MISSTIREQNIASSTKLYSTLTTEDMYLTAVDISPNLAEMNRNFENKLSQLLGNEFCVVQDRSFGGETPGERRNDRWISKQFPSPICGRIVRAVRSSVKSIPCENGSRIQKWECNGANHVILSQVKEASGKLGIEAASNALQKCQFSFSDVIRTWFYIGDILGRYDLFNRERIDSYLQLGISSDAQQGGRFPASTGVGVSDTGRPHHLELYAVQNGTSEIVESPAQKDAALYGSAFSRGAIIKQRDNSLIQLSGTAAIDNRGHSLYKNDFISQVACTFEKIHTLLATHDSRIDDMAAGCAFVKNAHDLDAYFQFVSDNKLEHLPLVPVIADICRDELLFEVDGELLVDDK